MNDEIKIKLSSKIVQLTRIIYLLNAKNEETEMIVESIISEKEKEHQEENNKLLKQIISLKNEIKDCKKTYEEKLDNFKIEIEYKYNRAISKIQKEYDDFKNSKKNVNEELQYEFELKVSSMLSQLKKVKDDYAKNIFEHKDTFSKLNNEL